MLSSGLLASASSLFVRTWDLFSRTLISRCTCVVPSIKRFNSAPDGPPKRPLNGYMRFVQQQRPVLSKRHPGMRYADITKTIALQWKELPQEQKMPFQEASAAAREMYHAEMAEYRAQLTAEQSTLLEEEKRQKKARKEALRKQKELKELCKPKRPRTAFNIFMSEHYKVAVGETILVKLITLNEIWKKLKDKQKQMYLQLAEDDKVRYREEIRIWEENMRKMGREDLLRKTVTRIKK